MGNRGSTPCLAHDTSSCESEEESSNCTGSDSEPESDSQVEQPTTSPSAYKVNRNFKPERSRGSPKSPFSSCCPKVSSGIFQGSDDEYDDEFQSTHSLRTRSEPSHTKDTGRKAWFPHNSGFAIEDYFEVQWRSEVGAGGYASVYIGRHKATQEEKAVKAIQKNMVKNCDRLFKEIEFAMGLDHPNIAKLSQTFEDRRYIYVVMELCRGGELFDLLQRQRTIKEGDTAKIMQQIFKAVNYMHTEGVCHRDLKPENFLFLNAPGPDDEIEGNTLKVIDFGISARFKSPSDTFSTRTGTPYYVAPEVLEHSNYGPQCDLWSCGVVMFVLLSGKLPFRGHDDRGTFSKVKQAKVTFQGETWNTVSDDAKQLIRHLLHKTPTDRYTASQALQDPWVVQHAPHAKKAPLHEGVARRLHEYATLNAFKKAALHAVAREMDDEEIRELTAIFQELDQDSNGTVSAAEILEGLRRANVKSINEEHLPELVRELDSDGSELIDYTEFLAATLDRRHCDDERACWNAFRNFDRNGDGKIDRDELLEVFKNQDLPGKKRTADELMKEVDANGDGTIDFEEFLAMMQKKH